MGDLIYLSDIKKTSILDQLGNDDTDFDALAKKMMKDADRQLRTEYEMYRYNLQMTHFSHNDIRDKVASNVKKLFKFQTAQTEVKLVDGRIDILATNKNQFVGIEIKKIAQANEAEQFIRYKKELDQIYGETSRLIVLASRFTDKLLSSELNGIELWRYEVWWKKSNKPKFLIDEIRVCRLTEDNIYKRLFEDKIEMLKK